MKLSFEKYETSKIKSMNRLKIFKNPGFVFFTLFTLFFTASFLSRAKDAGSLENFKNGSNLTDGYFQTATPPKYIGKKKQKQKNMTTKLIAVPPGIWRADHIILNVAANGVTIEYDCADGQIDKSLMIDVSGNFTADGFHVARQAGPVNIDDKQIRQPARYVGKISGDTMTLSVTLLETKQAIGKYTLQRGKLPEMNRCY